MYINMFIYIITIVSVVYSYSMTGDARRTEAVGQTSL